MKITAVLLFAIAILSGVIAESSSLDDVVRNTLWTVSTVAACAGLVFVYAIGIRWARFRKRLWG